MLDQSDNIKTSRDPKTSADDIIRSTQDTRTHDIGIGSIMIEISPTLEPWSL